MFAPGPLNSTSCMAANLPPQGCSSDRNPQSKCLLQVAHTSGGLGSLSRPCPLVVAASPSPQNWGGKLQPLPPPNSLSLHPKPGRFLCLPGWGMRAATSALPKAFWRGLSVLWDHWRPTSRDPRYQRASNSVSSPAADSPGQDRDCRVA